MFSTREMPSASSLFSTYASMTASVMLVRTMVNDLVPNPVRVYAHSAFRHFFKTRSSDLTLIIEDNNNISRNQIYDAAEVYLSTKISPNTARLRICKTPKEKNITIRLEKDEKIIDSFQGIAFKWRFIHSEPERNHPHEVYPSRSERRSFELSFPKKHKDIVFDSYVPFILEEAKAIRDDQRVLRMFTLNTSQCYGGGGGIRWDSINLEHPSTFETLAMEPDLKNLVMEDLNRFVRRKDFYKRVGRAWKRGYLLYGPPGTGKSSLVAAMANYLKFDIYDLQLANIMRDSDLRRLLLSTGNRSILVIEDIDCSVDLPDRRSGDGLQRSDDHFQQSKAPGTRSKDKGESSGAKGQFNAQLTLSGLLNFIDGLWSSCGDERIIIFTTNHKERLDPALLRPGRMDMHIHMSYCTPHGFKLLAANYLGISGEHSLYGEIESLIETTEVTPAQVAGELMKSEDADVALEELVNLLKRKKLEGDGVVDEAAATTTNQEIGTKKLAKRQKTENTKPRKYNGRKRTTKKKS
ncbi:hypothetical protein Dsin_011214 [Dipteronia sinensis]|uniref:AAA+ ATPase domain-containing protein n=1 Tax=Dipteronia sinensis TaxID=43782 RepID=A0AAE0AV84_9ROSI|nr:hypothetical protein Dsin_011214 [Dipteronia sinensis]